MDFEVMHFILHARVWLDQGFHVNPHCLHGYGLCCRMSNPTPDDDTTSGSNIMNPPDARSHGPVTIQHSTVGAMAQAAAATATAAAQAAAATPAPAPSQGAQSVTATIDYHSLARAMSRLNDDNASNLEKDTQLKWDFKTETFVDWQHKVEIWADSHDVRHLLEHPPVAAPGQLRKHEIAKCIIQPTLPNHDRAYVRGSQTQNEIWSKLQAKYIPSIDAEARKLWSRFSALRQAGRPMVEHCCDTRQCRCSYQCTGYGLVHGRLTICLRVLSRVRNIL